MRAPLGSTTWRPTGSNEFCLNHEIFGVGLPFAVHFKMAVWVSLTVVSTGGCRSDGSDKDFPGSPFWPFTPFGPLGPSGPGVPGNPRSPLNPVEPLGPSGPCLPGGPSGPGFPRGPRRPWLPFGPGLQRISFLAHIWSCSWRSSSLISNFTSETSWSEGRREERFCLAVLSLRIASESASFSSALKSEKDSG